MASAETRDHANFGLALAGAGRKAEALHEAAVALAGRDAYESLEREEKIARIQVMVGEHEAAIATLGHLLSIPSLVSVGSLQVDPTWDPLRSNPRFQALLAKYDKPSR